MKKCRYCNVEVDSDKNFCPICFNRTDNLDDRSTGLYTLRKHNETKIKSSWFLTKLFFFLTICTLTASVMVNVLVTPKSMWSPLVVFGELYIWVLIAHTIMSKRSLFEKVFLQVVVILLILIFAEKLSISDWLIPYVYPSMSLAVVTTLSLILIISSKRGEYFIGFTVIAFLLSIGSLVFILFSLTGEFKLLNYISLAVGFSAVFGYVLFGFDSIKYELGKKWHL
ncbi:MAG: hypothetical protein J5762_05520 [Clostridia bacterium]|nr:hypothetical protein [Clostridia bacterium]